MKQVICLSTSNFYPMPTRKQNVMRRLSDSEILYFDPPVSLLAPLKDPSSFKRLFRFLKKGVIENNITVYAMPPVLPFFNKYRFINKINQFFAGIFVRSKIKHHKFKDIVLWCYSPSYCDIKIKYSGLVYDCVDRHSQYPGMINKDVVNKMEKDLASKADMVFSTAIGLHETLLSYNKNARLIPNGSAYEIFSRAHFETFDIPDALKGKSHPIFGFVGMLQECIDYELIERIANEIENSTVIMIGKPLPGVNIDRLKKYENIIITGLIPQEDLPKYISHFDVCLNTFTAGGLSTDVSPLKFYEYLSTGKPIVSTREPIQVLDFEDLAYIAHNRDDFIDLCLLALAEKDSEKVLKRLTCGKNCSWSARVKQMEEILRSEGVL